MSKVSTFLGYYKVSDVGIREILKRNAVTVPSTKVSKGAAGFKTAAEIATEIVGVITDNELIPVTLISTEIESEVTSVLTDLFEDSDEFGTFNSAKFGLKIATSGPNKGVGVLTITTKLSKVKYVTELIIETPEDEG